MLTVGSLVMAAWVGACAPAQVVQEGDPARGEQRFGQIGCNGCHLVDEVGGMIGPDLTGVASRPLPETGRWPSVPAYLEESIRNPQAYVAQGFPPDMPSAEKLQLGDRDIRDLVAYLLTLRRDRYPVRNLGPPRDMNHGRKLRSSPISIG